MYHKRKVSKLGIGVIFKCNETRGHASVFDSGLNSVVRSAFDSHSVRNQFSWKRLESRKSRYQAVNIDIAASSPGVPWGVSFEASTFMDVWTPLVSLEAK